MTENPYDFIDTTAEVQETPPEQATLGTEPDEAAEVTTEGSPSKGDTPAKDPDECQSFAEWLWEGLKDAFYALRKD